MPKGIPSYSCYIQLEMVIPLLALTSLKGITDSLAIFRSSIEAAHAIQHPRFS